MGSSCSQDEPDQPEVNLIPPYKYPYRAAEPEPENHHPSNTSKKSVNYNEDFFIEQNEPKITKNNNPPQTIKNNQKIFDEPKIFEGDQLPKSLKMDRKPENLLGKGSFGSVYKAYYEGSAVAVKILHNCENMEGETIEEIMNMKKLVHPNIVKYIAHFFKKSEQSLYIIMELAKGTLKEKITQQISPQSLYQIIWELVSGLDYAHKQGIYHSDIKPSNILIFPNPLMFGSIFKLSDWGESKDMSETIGKSGKMTIQANVISGTPSYLAPEMENCLRKLDANSPEEMKVNYFKTDVFSLGVMLYELLGGDLKGLRQVISKELDLNSIKREKYYVFLQEQKRKLKQDQQKIDPTIIELIFSMLGFEKDNRNLMSTIRTS